MGNKPGWAIELDGEEIDILDLRRLLAAPFDPWVEDYETNDGPKTVLRVRNWSNVTELSIICRDAERILDHLNGALLLIHHDVKPVKVGRVVTFGPYGQPEYPSLSVQMNSTIEPFRMRASLTTEDSTELSQSLLQEWYQDAESNTDRSDLFRHLARLNDWYDLYKSMEITRRMAGQKSLDQALGDEKREWGAIWQTANCYRHAPNPNKFPLPVSAPGWNEARELVLKTIARVLQNLPQL